AWYWLGQTATLVQILGAVVLLAAVVHLQRGPMAVRPSTGGLSSPRGGILCRGGPDAPKALRGARTDTARRPS
ncbi:hypothetical protein AB4Z54_40810, partial [Streptomyces sp. MCAF7]